MGEIKKEKRDRKGIMYYNDGTKYEGEYKNDNRDGYGILFLIMEIDMKDILIKINMKEKVHYIIKMVLNKI